MGPGVAEALGDGSWGGSAREVVEWGGPGMAGAEGDGGWGMEGGIHRRGGGVVGPGMAGAGGGWGDGGMGRGGREEGWQGVGAGVCGGRLEVFLRSFAPCIALESVLHSGNIQHVRQVTGNLAYPPVVKY